ERHDPHALWRLVGEARAQFDECPRGLDLPRVHRELQGRERVEARHGPAFVPRIAGLGNLVRILHPRRPARHGAHVGPRAAARPPSAWPSAAAPMSAVCPRVASRASTPAPWASSARTASSRPARAAVINTVSPPGEAVSGSAPAFSRRSTTAPFPLAAASASGVAPERLAAYAAPARSSTSPASASAPSPAP